MRKEATEKSGKIPYEELVAKIDELTKKLATKEAELATKEAETAELKGKLEKLRKELESEKSSRLKCEVRLKETAEELDRSQSAVQTFKKASAGGGNGFVPDKALETALLGIFAEFTVKVNELAEESTSKIQTEFEQTRVKAKEKAKAKAEAERKKANEAEKAALVAELKALAEKAESKL